jgi:type IV pilus assembly protein PilV
MKGPAQPRVGGKVASVCAVPAQGVALLEILVAVLVLSLGLLGLAGLQVTGLRSNHNAYLRTQAALLAYDIADRMRSNVDGATAGDYVVSGPPGAAPSFDCMTNFSGTAETDKCSATEMARVDIYLWYEDLADRLPSGTGSISCADNDPGDTIPCTRGSIHTLTVAWSELEVPDRLSTGPASDQKVDKRHVLEILP